MTDTLETSAERTQRIDAVPAGAGPAPSPEPSDSLRRIHIRSTTVAGTTSVLGSMAGALALVWVLYERVLPTSGALGFWLCCYAAFLVLYVGVCRTQWPRRLVVDRLVTVIVASAGLLVLAIVVDQVGYVLFRGWAAVQHSNFFSQTMALAGPLDPLTSGGVMHALVGSLEQMAIATILAVPLGLFAALFLVEVGGTLARPVRTIVEAMTALPEIIAGLFVYAFAVLSLGLDQSGLAAALALTVMMIPIVTRSAEVILRLVPGGLREAAYALGASQVRTVFTVVLPTARSGLATAVILAMARAVGETSPVLLTAGFTSGLNADPLSGPQVSLPLYIYSYVRFPQSTMVARAFGAGLALMIMVLFLFAVARLVGGKAPGEFTRRQRHQLRRDARRAQARTSAARAAITPNPQMSEA